MKRKRKKQAVENIRYGTKVAMLRLRVNGRRASRFIPYGYGLAADGLTLIHNEAEYQTVLEMGKLLRAGKSYRKVAEHLNASGFKPRTAQRWYASTIHSVVRRMAKVYDERNHWRMGLPLYANGSKALRRAGRSDPTTTR